MNLRHIEMALKPFFEQQPDVVLDGEFVTATAVVVAPLALVVVLPPPFAPDVMRMLSFIVLASAP